MSKKVIITPTEIAYLEEILEEKKKKHDLQVDIEEFFGDYSKKEFEIEKIRVNDDLQKKIKER